MPSLADDRTLSVVDDRALSHMVSYVLLLGVAIILVAGLSMAGSDLLTGQHEQTVQAELNVVGERVAADIATADRLTQTAGDQNRVRVTSDAPRTVSGGTYHLTVTNHGSVTTLTLESRDTGVTTEVNVTTATPVEDAELAGGTNVIEYDDGNDRLVIERE